MKLQQPGDASTMPVPYITAYSGETDPSPLVFTKNHLGALRLAYEHARDDDRRLGVLRARAGQSREGRPIWGSPNVRRQWECMENLLCQVCGCPATDDRSGRVPWLVTDGNFRRTGIDGGQTATPPTCLDCMPLALSLCPHLRDTPAVYMVGKANPVSVLAHVYTPAGDGYAAFTGEHNVELPLSGSDLLSYAVAHRLVMSMSEITPIWRVA